MPQGCRSQMHSKDWLERQVPQRDRLRRHWILMHYRIWYCHPITRNTGGGFHSNVLPVIPPTFIRKTYVY